jgi:hypothetical protein
VHVPGSVPELVRRLAAGVASGGTLLLVGHRPADPATRAPTPAAGQLQIFVEEAVAALDPALGDFRRRGAAAADGRHRRWRRGARERGAESTYDDCLPPTRLQPLNVCPRPQHVS